MNGLLPHHIAAIERAILMNEQQASALAENGDYSAEMPAGDAEALREVLSEIAALKAECERLRQQCQEEIRLRSEAATRAIAAEAECERLRRDAEQAKVKEREICAATVFAVQLEYLEPDSDDLGTAGWLQRAKDAIRNDASAGER